MIIENYKDYEIVIINQDKELQNTYKCEYYNILKSIDFNNKITYINENQIINYHDTKNKTLMLSTFKESNKDFLINQVDYLLHNKNIVFITPILFTSINNKLIKHWFLTNKIDLLPYNINIKVNQSTRIFFLMTNLNTNNLKAIISNKEPLNNVDLPSLKNNNDIKIVNNLSWFNFKKDQLYLTNLINITQLNKNKFLIIEFGTSSIRYNNIIYKFIDNNNNLIKQPQLLFTLK